MTVHTTVAPRVGERHRWLLIGAAALAAVVIGAVLALTFTSNDTTSKSAATGAAGSVSSTPRYASTTATIMALTPARFAAGALDYGYALPQVPHGPTVASVLASLSPSTRRYTKAVMALTFAQLKAGAAGSP
jgi:hypothetical protein